MKQALLTFLMVTALSSSAYGTDWNQLGSNLGSSMQCGVRQYLDGTDYTETNLSISRQALHIATLLSQATDEECKDIVRGLMPFVKASLGLLEQNQYTELPHDEVAALRWKLELLIDRGNTILQSPCQDASRSGYQYS